IRIVQRQPGGVTGTGIHTVTELVKIAQQSRRHQYLSQRQGKLVLDIDEEAQSFLDQQRLTPDSIPEKDRFIRLRSRDNASSGGSTNKLTASDVHPDNLRLAVATAKALRLDFAGIDLIISDITESWMQQKAAICEVNAQPTLGATDSPHLYQDILHQLVPNAGRIPVHLLVLATDEMPELSALQEIQAQLHCNGLSCKAGVFVNEERFAAAFENSHNAAKSVLLNSDVASALCVYHASEIVRYGFMSNRFDSVQVLGVDQATAEDNAELQGAISLLPPDCAPSYNG
ncbi:MAG: hypothetical protein MI746_09845, partial [Pseudomonadales bacterium]|nr:hypothetical protein [Pseudomonadales bacterium]